MKKSVFIQVLFSAALMLAPLAVTAGEITTDDVQGGMERGKAMVKEVPTNPNITEGEKEALKILERHNSPEYQKLINSEISRIQNYFETGKWDAPEQAGKAEGKEPYYSKPSGTEPLRTNLAGDERIYILISSSMPLQTIRNYGFAMANSKDSRVKMVLRGFVEEPGTTPIIATKKFVKRVLTGQDGKCIPREGCQRLVIPTGIQIDPFVFRRFEVVDNVPAIIYAQGVTVKDVGRSEGGETHMQFKESYILRGDVSLEYAIEVFQRNLAAKGKKSPGLEKLLSAVRGPGGY